MRMVSTLSWKEVFSFNHGSNFDELTEFNSQPDLNIYVETDQDDGPVYEAVSKPFKILKLTPHSISQI
jgi:hypothetical protein